MIDGVGVTKVISPAAGAVEGRVNTGSVESVEEVKVGGSPLVLVEVSVKGVPPECV